VDVSTGPFDMDDFRAEHRKLGRRKGLRNHDARTDHTDSLKRPEFRCEHRRLRSLEILDPVGYGRFEFFDLILILENSLVMLSGHPYTPSFID
jgi:hypothetical protein